MELNKEKLKEMFPELHFEETGLGKPVRRVLALNDFNDARFSFDVSDGRVLHVRHEYTKVDSNTTSTLLNIILLINSTYNFADSEVSV